MFLLIWIGIFVASSGGTDEFGRDRGTYEESARQRRIAEREGRRNRRRKRRRDNVEHHEGLSSDNEELDAEVTKFNSDKGILVCVLKIRQFWILGNREPC